MSRSIKMLVVVSLGVVLGLLGCKTLKEGECERAQDCDEKFKNKGACYREPPTAETGKCMSIMDAKAADERYKKKLTGTCVDKDGDGSKKGDACEGQQDCNDDDPAIKPGAAELCDSKDNNCNGIINEGLTGCVGTVLGGKEEPIAQFMLTMAAGVKVAPNGNIWATDQHRIYRLEAGALKATRVAGSEKPGRDDKKGTLATFDQPRGLAITADGTVYVTDCGNNCVRKIETDGQVSTYAGLCSSEADDTGLDKDGSAQEARFWCPIDIAFDREGNLLVVDMYNAKIKRIGKDRSVSTFAGAGGKNTAEGVEFGFSNGAALKAEFNEPAGIAVGADGAVFVADSKNNCIRRIAGGQVGTFAGTCGKDKGGTKDGPAAAAQFTKPNGLDVGPDGTVWVADTFNHTIRKVAGGQVTTVSGKAGQQGYYDGAVKDALYNGPQSVSIAKDGSVYLIDFGNYRVRRLVP